MEFGLLGPFSASNGVGELALGGQKQRTVLAHLVLRANREVTQDLLIDLVWDDDPPLTARGSLQAYVSRLRTVLGPDRIEGRSGRYVLYAVPDELDAVRFETMAAKARRTAIADPGAAATMYRTALGLWRGPALADLADVPSLQPEVVRLDELRLAVTEELMATELTLGRHREVVPELEALVDAHRFREQLCCQLMLALYRCGRQQEALEVYQRVRASLTDDLGLDPGPELQRLRDQVLRQEAGLDFAGRPLRGYRLLEQVGAGTFGTVHRAYQPEVGREVAVKVIRPALANNPEYIRRFAAEAELAARLEHPHVVPLHDYWREPDGAFLVMRYMRGGSLRAALADGPLPPQRVVQLVEQVASALAFLHRQGVVHRDVKPANILFDEDGNAYLSDFGIARQPTVRGGHERLPRPLAAYLSPEEARGEPVDARADIYNLAVVAFEALSGRHPFAEATPDSLSDLHAAEPLPSLRSSQPGLPGSVDDVIARASAKDPACRPVDAVVLAEELRTAFAPLLRAPAALEAAEPVGLRNPYKGLRAFRESDAADFHGRRRLVDELVARLGDGDARFVAVVGPSGSGKSSLVSAGLLPALRRGAVPGSQSWFAVEMYPGAHPFEELAAALTRVAATPQPGLVDALQREGGLVDAAVGVLPDRDTELLLVIDQFEEVFTLVEDDDQRRRFLDAIATAATDPRGGTRVVVTLRADFYDLPLAHPAIAELTRLGTFSVTPLLSGEIERAITGPAEAVGVSVERALLAALVADVIDQSASLPLLQYALTEMFEHRDGSRLTLAAYDTVGGVTGALAQRADELFTRLPVDGQLAARQLFLRLVTISAEGGEPTRRRETRAQLNALDIEPALMTAVIDAFGAHRLLTFDRDPVTRGPTIEVAHEALLREWARLRGWLDAARDDILTHRRLATAAREWSDAGGEDSALLRGERLRRFESWAETSVLALTADERRFLTASAARRDEEQAETERRAKRERALEQRSLVRLRVGIAAAAVLALVASLLTVVALDQRSKARAEARAAHARELASSALATIGQDPELSTLLALEAVEAGRRKDGTVLREAEEALHRAVKSMRTIRTFGQGGFGIAVSADGGRLVTAGSGGDDDVPTVWDATTGNELLRLPDAAGATTVAMSPDGRLLATANPEGKVRLWDASSGVLVGTLDSGTEYVSQPVFSPDGRRLAVGGADGKVRIWDVASRTQSRLLTGATDAIFITAFSPDGTLVAAGGADTVLHVWDTRSGRQVASMTGHEWPISGLSFSPDGRSVATGAFDAEIRIWDPTSGSLLRLLAGPSPIQALAYSPDGKRLVSAASDATTTLWDLTTGRELLHLVGHSGGPIGNVAFMPDGDRVVTSGLDATTRLWDVSVGGARDWLTVPGVQKILSEVTFSPDGAMFAAPAHPNGVSVWETATGKEVIRLAGPPQKLTALAFSPDGTKLVAGSDTTSAPPVWDVRTGKLLFTLDGQSGFIRAVAFSPDGTRIATGGSFDGGLHLWDARTGAAVSPGRRDFEGETLSLRYSPDGRLLVSGEGDLVRIRDAATLEPRRELTGFTGNPTGFAFGPDDMLAASDTDGTARVWDLGSGKELAVFRAHRGPVNQIAFSPDGTRIATGGEDGTTRLWEPRTGTETFQFVGHTSLVSGVSFSPDGRLLATASPDGTVALHVLPVDEFVTLARSRLTRGLTTAECRTYLHQQRCDP